MTIFATPITNMASAIRTFDLGYDDADPLAFARLVKALFPSWEKVEVERMTGGVNNTVKPPYYSGRSHCSSTSIFCTKLAIV